MKVSFVTVCSLVGLAAFGAAPSIGGMPNMPGMSGTRATAKTGKGVGVITALDPKAAKITIKHGPIPAAGWPAMTMTFAAKPPSLLGGLKVGQTIAFDTRVQGPSATVTAIHRP